MIKSIGIVFLITLLSIIIKCITLADTVSFCDYTHMIFYSSITDKIYLSCAGDASTLDLITINPLTLCEECNFPIGGLGKMVIPVDEGSNLLLLLSELDGIEDTAEGALKKVNAQTGVLVPGCEIQFDEWPLTGVVDNNQDYAYVSVGLNMIPADIYKISLSTFQVVPPVVSFGELPDVMAITNDGSKLYVKSNEMFEDENVVPSFDSYYYQIGVINTSTMTLNEPIKIMNVMPFHFVMGYDNRLFVSHPYPIEEHNTDISLIVINTINDTIEKELSFNEIGIWHMEIDPIHQKLYGCVWYRNYYDPEFDLTYHVPSPVIVEFDLTDPSYAPNYLTLDDEGLWMIAVSTIPDCPRLFAIAEKSEYVHYMDL